MSGGRVNVKICGLTRAEDARAAVAAGADAIGLNFVAGPRRIAPEAAEPILAALSTDIERWALLDLGGGEIPDPEKKLPATGRITRVQAYGDADCRSLAVLRRRGLSVVAVRHLHGPESIRHTRAWLEACGDQPPELLLLDAGGAGRLGGTGRTLDWRMIAEHRARGALDGWPPLVLAGGLTPENVADAVRIVSPAWVDVSSGVESVPGVKDPTRMQAFVAAVRAAAS